MTSPLISTEWCFRPYKPYISCEDIWSHAPHVFRGAIQVDTFFTRWMPIASLLSSKSIRYRVAQNACIRAFLEEIIYLPILTKWRPQVLFIVGKLCDTSAQIFSFILRPCHTFKSEFCPVVLFAHNWLSDSICHFQNIIHSPHFHYSQLVIMGLVCLFVCYIWLCFCLLCLFFVVIFRCASISWFKAVNTSHFFHPAHLLTFFVIYYICLMFIAAFTHLFVCCIVVSK